LESSAQRCQLPGGAVRGRPSRSPYAGDAPRPQRALEPPFCMLRHGVQAAIDAAQNELI